MGKRSIIKTVIRARNIVALMLLVAWPVVTSHALLQSWGIIHEIHADHDSGGGSHEHDTDHHAFADGGYLRGSSDISVSKPAVATALPLLVMAQPLTCFTGRDVFNSGPSPPGTAPPELLPCWQFAVRAAPRVRAPSLPA